MNDNVQKILNITHSPLERDNIFSIINMNVIVNNVITKAIGNSSIYIIECLKTVMIY